MTGHYRVRVLADSISPCGVRATTFALQAPRPILAEFNTHRAVSRNAASNRAVPIDRLVEEVLSRPYVPGDLPAMPLRGNNVGMVAYEVLDESRKASGRAGYYHAAKAAAESARQLAALGWHKQDVNRLLEPFGWVRIVATATDWDNFFALRCDFRAYPPIAFLARSMYVARLRSEPRPVAYGGWHLPFVTEADRAFAFNRHGTSADPDNPPRLKYDADLAVVRWSAARCARVSYGHFGAKAGEVDRDRDDVTFAKLIADEPRHVSPMEHQLLCDRDAVARRSNVRFPWVQFRKLLDRETVHHYEPADDVVASWEVPESVFAAVEGW